MPTFVDLDLCEQFLVNPQHLEHFRVNRKVTKTCCRLVFCWNLPYLPFPILPKPKEALLDFPITLKQGTIKAKCYPLNEFKWHRPPISFVVYGFCWEIL